MNPSPASLEVVETCFATLHFGESEVFKRRKPVVLEVGDEHIDLVALEARRAACLEEERLDRRLAPDATLGVVPLVRGPGGQLHFGGEGEAVDWALHMRRLPDARRADRLLHAGTLTDAHLQAVARRLVAFHEAARGSAKLDADSALARLRAQIATRPRAAGWENKTPLPPEVEEIEAWQHVRLDALCERVSRRAERDGIREGHGELELEHVFFDAEGGVQILAGLEMSRGLRHADVAADVALLATDLAARHRMDLAERFVAAYAELSKDFDLYPLLDFHASLRASLRGKLDWLCADRFSLQAGREHARRERAYRERARRFFALALSAPRRPLLPAAVVAMGGQVASGKSTVAAHVARRIGAPVVGSDAMRDFLLGARVNEALHEIRWEEAYEPGFSERVYDEVLRCAAEVLASGRPVVIDGCFRSREQRRRARALAERLGRPFLFVEARVDPDLQRARLAERSRRDNVSDAVWQEIADNLRAGWEPVDDLPEDEHLALDTALPLDANADSIESRLPTWPSGLTG